MIITLTDGLQKSKVNIPKLQHPHHFFLGAVPSKQLFKILWYNGCTF